MNPSARLLLSLAIPAVMAIGCSKFQEANPWVDRSTPGAAISTPSADGVYAANKPPARRQRVWDQTAAARASENTTHWPLWWEDPFEDKGSDNDRFAWTWEDYLAMPYGLGRFLVNTMAWPVSATVTHPFTVLASDGELSKQPLGYDHDAETHKPQPAPAEAIESQQTTEAQPTTSAPAPNQ